VTSSVFSALASASRARARYSSAGDDIQEQRPGSAKFRNQRHTHFGRRPVAANAARLERAQTFAPGEGWGIMAPLI
jgi:hypothetical protein